MTIIRIGLDTSKYVFQIHGVDENEKPVLRRQLRRSEVERFFAQLPPTRNRHRGVRRLASLGAAVARLGARGAPRTVLEQWVIHGAGHVPRPRRVPRSRP
jgi:hypothetical protein